MQNILGLLQKRETKSKQKRNKKQTKKEQKAKKALKRLKITVLIRHVATLYTKKVGT